jgi:hypothetical protein
MDFLYSKNKEESGHPTLPARLVRIRSMQSFGRIEEKTHRIEMLWEGTLMKKICFLLVFCLCLSACTAFAEKTADAAALIEQARTALENGDYETAVPILR